MARKPAASNGHFEITAERLLKAVLRVVVGSVNGDLRIDRKALQNELVGRAPWLRPHSAHHGQTERTGRQLK